jgi:CRP/FNR family cyclic AMP-dependent transcriptional regulator
VSRCTGFPVYRAASGLSTGASSGRPRWLSFHLAVCQIIGIEVRLLIVLWHFADRWGRVTPEGVMLPLPLSHGLLAGIVGSRRPTVSTALGSLRNRGRRCHGR